MRGKYSLIVNKITREKKLVQVSWSISDPETRKREIAPLVNAGRKLGIRQRLLITWDEEGSADDGVQIIPIWKYLTEPCP